MSDSEFDALLVEALTLYSDDLLRDIPAEETLRQEQSFSARFEEQMDKLIRRAAMTTQQLRRHIAGQVAMIALVVILGLTSLMSVEAIRVPVVRFFTEVHETFTRIVFGAETGDNIAAVPEQIEQVYVPEFVPEGFALEYEMLDSSMVVFAYSNGEDSFQWTQYCLNEMLYVDTENTSLQEFTRDNVSYSYYENKDRYTLVWEQNGYCFICGGTVSKEILIDIVESIKIKK